MESSSSYYSATEAPTNYHINRITEKLIGDLYNLVVNFDVQIASKNIDFFINDIECILSKCKVIIESDDD